MMSMLVKCYDAMIVYLSNAMKTFFIRCDDPMEEKAKNIASSSVAPAPL